MAMSANEYHHLTTTPLVKKNGQLSDGFKPEKKKAIRFDGFPEEEIFNRRVPDHLAPNLDILMVK